MDIYFIRVKKGLFNQYFSKEQSSKEVSFTVEFKKAKVFSKVEDAQEIINHHKIQDSMIINQNGVVVLK